ncbi:RnfABCDGE type electron transport complex subunit D [uncultured Alistipes sp.]|uniref:RnfABCDGE type electron transport complex subunit D n=1 Tax=uncultured Alistipes sp. TaxID=538949 RepID=UPI0026020557|nr:RnfABCDGE type electron transport complex subunit D [uncultured Alistipes sp.]
MANRLVIAPAPHVHGSESTQKIMRDVLLALTPALIFSIVVFGWSALMVTCVSVASCVLFEFLIQKFLLRGPRTIGDLSAVVTGVLLAFNVPASLPWWIVVIGAFVSIAIAKMTFGGLGKNPFNPALVGRVFLLFAYPVQMTSFPRPVGQLVDAFSGATPLAAVKAHIVSHTDINFQDILFGSIPGSLGEISALLLIVGFIYLLWRKVITWHIPVSILGTMALFVFIVGLSQGMQGEVLWEFPIFHLLAGGAILGAVYMATDYSTSPMTHAGMIIYGIGIGVITVLIRLWGAYPEGMSFAILIMNSVVPLINKYVKPHRFGVK